jgi:aminoglycoside phosphotransferase family enzyme/predicted kinase
MDDTTTRTALTTAAPAPADRGPAGGLVEALRRPEAYPPPVPARVELVTTHISWVFLTDHDVWKLKRPVDYGFLDYTTLERRHHACEEEVRLNERLAPGVYLGVVPVRLGPAGPALTGDGPIVDYAVHMRRLADTASAEALLRAGALEHDHLWLVAGVLARFYAEAAATPRYGSVALIEANLAENFEQARPFVGRFLGAATLDAVRAWQVGFLARHRDRFAARIDRHRVREGHGDLRLEHVYVEEGRALIIDCIEFNERFRMGDVASDVAFLAMELEARGRPDLAGSFLGRFALESDDYDLYDVVDFYLSYRAWVRGKVSAFLAADPSTPPDKARRKAEEAQALFARAERYTRPPALPGPVLAVGGVIGAGKTVLAEALARALALPVVASDRTRKWLAGVGATERAPAAAYEPAFSDRTFDEVFRRAAVVVGSGRGVILDATFRGRHLRRRARELAARHGRRFLFVEATCDDATLRERLRRRAAGPSVSDATDSLLARVRAEFEAVTELAPAEHLVVRTTEPVPALVESVREALRR